MIKQQIKRLLGRNLDRVFVYLFTNYLFTIIFKKRFPKLKDSHFIKNYPSLFLYNIEIIDYDETENFIYVKKDNLYMVTTPNYTYILKEIFGMNIYFINPRYFKSGEYVVFDIGMNRGYSSIYFANHAWCKEVYGFELIQFTYDIAKKNIDLNFGIKNKIKTFNFGLGDKDEMIKSYHSPYRDGISSISKEFLLQYAPKEMEKMTEVESNVKKSSKVLKEIVEKNNIVKIILKIDVEGAEYAIFNDIVKEYPEFLYKVDIIIGEAHLGLEPLLKVLLPFGFKDVSTKSFNTKTHDFLLVKN